MYKSKVIILCHGTWGQSLIDDLEKLFGISNDYIVLALTMESDISEYMKQVGDLVDKEDVKLIISDLYGGSTSNVAINVAIKKGIDAINGLSLQTILIVDEELNKKDTIDGLATRIVKRNSKICVDLIEEFKKI